MQPSAPFLPAPSRTPRAPGRGSTTSGCPGSGCPRSGYSDPADSTESGSHRLAAGRRAVCTLRLPMLGIALLLGGCDPAGQLAFGAANVAAVPLMGRTVPDAAYSLVTGKDCSLVRVDKGESWCRDAELPPQPPTFCTRSLGAVDCWKTPPLANPPLNGVADGPMTLNAAQEADRRRRWPGLF